MTTFCALCFGLLLAGEKVMETVVPALTFGGSCSSSIQLQNTADAREVAMNVETRRADGSLAAGSYQQIPAGDTLMLKPDIVEETTGAWILLRERVAFGSRPVLAVRGAVSCVENAIVRTLPREVTYPMHNPFFDADTAGFDEASILLINTTQAVATTAACYSSGAEYSLPGQQLHPVCSSVTNAKVPPFGSFTFPLIREGSTHLNLRAYGDGIALQLQRPVAGSTRMFTVESSITFGSAP